MLAYTKEIIIKAVINVAVHKIITTNRCFVGDCLATSLSLGMYANKATKQPIAINKGNAIIKPATAIYPKPKTVY